MGNTGAAANELIAGRYRLQEVVHREVNSVCWYGEDTAYARPRLLTRTRLPPGGPPGGPAGAAVARITHASEVMGERCPGAVARVLDVIAVGEAAGEPGGLWTVVEWIDGMPLGEFLDRHGVLDPVRAARLGLDILDVVESAHDAGLVHGELSPGQVFVRDHGGVVVSGYGLAGAGPVARIGAPAYASPEQARGEPYGAPADLWALGALLHTMTEGRPPFRDRGRPEATCKAVVRLPPRSPRRAGPLTEVVQGLLDKDPYERWTGPEVREVLSRVLGDPGDSGDRGGFGGAGAFGADPATAPAEVLRPGASPAFVSAAGSGGSGGRRRNPGRAALVGAAAVAAVAVTVTVLAVTGDGSGSGSPAPDAAATRTAPVLPTGDGIEPATPSVSPVPSAPSAPGATAPAGSPSPTASPSPSAPPTSPSSSGAGAGAGALPAGFRVFTAPEGFAVALPEGWKRIDTGRARDGSYRVVLGADGDPRNLAVTHSTRVGSDPVAVWRDTVEPALRQGAGYDRLGAIRATTYQGREAADMEWVDESEGTRVRTFGRGFLVGGGEGFSLRWTTPDAEWDTAGNQRALKTFLATFRGSAD